jgi:hypothetical protein
MLSSNFIYKICLWPAFLMAIFLVGCASHVRKVTVAPKILTERQLLEINNENRFTRFYYSDGKTISGIMLRWIPDSVYIQPRGTGLPLPIPTTGLAKIETVTGNKMFIGLAIGTLVAGAYFIAIKGYDLNQVTFLEGLAKLLVPPAAILTAMGIGASRDTYESYLIPPNFKFDYDASKVRLQLGK